jgi:geranylgeranyl pyrophosphate synthase
VQEIHAARPSSPEEGIPPTKPERDRLLGLVRRYVEAQRPVPPLSLEEVEGFAQKVAEMASVDGNYRKFLMVLASNAAWTEALAGVPFDRRLLLLPQCLRDQARCAADVDEFGLLCHHCGHCPIHELQEAAERLGYVVLVAEGTVAVTSLLDSGKIEAVVGVGCLASLERVFPYMDAGAIPGLAIPLLRDGCANTSVDLDWVWDAIQLTRTSGVFSRKKRLPMSSRLDLDALRSEVEAWFAPESLDATMGPAPTQTERIARQWLAKSGKRWRPFLALCAFQALRDDPEAPAPAALRQIAVAIECFHKASLVHDDIEDNDPLRYGEQTLHEAHGVPIALNVGDFLLGEGYRLIAESDAPAVARAEMLRVASHGHRDLSIGQGEELCWLRHPAPLASRQVLDIFRHKTAPAFEVALRLGALCGGASDGLWEPLHECSEALGIAYQIRDDLEDFFGDEGIRVPDTIGPSILLAIAHERAEGEAKGLLDALWRSPATASALAPNLARALQELRVEQIARGLLEDYKQRAIRALRPLTNPSLKGLLRRVIGKIFNEIRAKT